MCRDANVIKWSVKCLGHLLKTLWKPISGQLEEIYKICEDLFRKNRPDYIRYLSAETLAFLMRKCGDKEAFLEIILAYDSAVIDEVAVAKILFESIKTVGEQFNVHCKKLWPMLVNKLTVTNSEILYKVCDFCAEHSDKENLEPLLEIIFQKVKDNKPETNGMLSTLIKLVLIFVGQKQGRLIKKPEKVIEIIEAEAVENLAQYELMDLCEVILKAENLVWSQSQKETIADRILSSKRISLQKKLDFISLFFDQPMFDNLLLRPYFGLIQENIRDNLPELIHHLSTLIETRSPLPSSGDQLRAWSPPVFDLVIVKSLRSIPNDQKFPSIILNTLNEMTSPSEIHQALLCLTSLRPVSKSSLEEYIVKMLTNILRGDSTDQMAELLPLLITVLQKTLGSSKSISDVVSWADVASLFKTNTSCKKFIQTFNFILSSLVEVPKVEKEEARALIESLQDNLSSSDSSVRQMCLQSIVVLLPALGKQVNKFHQECQLSLLDVFNHLLAAENTEDNLSSYKEKLNTLERIEYQRISKVFLGFEFLSTAPLKYLMGILYTNFTLLWNPVMDLIGSYGNGMKRDLFWPVFSNRLVLADTDIQAVITDIKMKKEKENSVRIDHISYRNHLWDILGRFANLAEAKNRDIVPLFLDNFMQTEYVEIRKLADDNELEEAHKNIIQTTVKSLLSHLNLFSKFSDLKSLHRSQELKDLVYSLLCHKLAPVQKVSLDILVGYKLKYLSPYKENLGRLLEDKDFKAELLNFPLGGDDSQIKEEHRADLLPVILRLLYGRMRAVKAGGRKKGGKGTVNARRGLILQNMMELSEMEMLIFFELVFKDLFTGSQLAEGDNVAEYIMRGGQYPVKTTKQLQACIEMMQVIMSKLGQLLSNNLNYLVSVIIWMGYIVNNLPYTDTVRSVKNNLYSLLATFYTKYSDFMWEDKSIEASLSVFVWKLLPKFETDFIHSSSGLLQVLLAWSKDRKYHFFFQRTSISVGNSRILEKTCKVLENPSTNPKVIMTILTVIHNLVHEDEASMEVDEEFGSQVGIHIVLKEMESILNYFQKWIKSSNEGAKNITKVGVKLDILITLAPHVTCSEASLQLFKQLLILSSSLKKPESVLKVLTISKLLVSKVPPAEVTSLMTSIVPMYGRVSTRKERLELSSVIENCAALEPELKRAAEICSDLNSYDKRRVEEPDFERRMKVFRRVRDLVKDEDKVTTLEVSCVIFNCCFFIKNETESSLKANAIEALNSVSKIIMHMYRTDPSVSKILIDKICFDHIKNGIKSKDDSVRSDFLNFLQSLVTNCAEASPRLRDLAKLTDTDLDSNILENLRHVQLHRRGRAMAKIAANLDSDPGFIKPKNLTQLFLPLAGSYLLNDSYARNSDLLDQAISLVRSIAGVLPWAQYEHSVKYYIEMFTKDSQHQKQLVKITSAVLDAFHFEVGDMFDNQKKQKLDKAESGEDEKSKEETQKSKIFWTVNNVLLPKLHGTLSGKQKGPASISDEDKLILRVPLAIPIVKMLKILSGKLLFRQVPGIVNKIISFLKSKAIEIREAARSTLCSVMKLLGPKYLGFVIKEMSANLQRGYLQHVLTYTTHSLVHSLADTDMLVPGDVDNVVKLVTDLALMEMFSGAAEEKEVRKITGKVMEARGSKCYDMLQIMAKFISNDQVFNLAKPFADKAIELSTFKNLQKLREIFRNIVLGLLDNKDLEAVNCLIFIYGIVMDKLDIGVTTKQKNTLKKDENLSIFIVPVAPKRTGAVAKNSRSASKHIVHEFGLNLLYFLLKRGSLLSNEELHCERLEPFIDILIGSLTSSHVSLVTTAVRCLFWLVKFPLKSLDDAKVMEITNKVFDLLNKFGGGTDGKGENHDLVIIASKLLVILIRDVELTKLDQNHLKTILTYVTNDVLDPFKATTAFGLLTAILNRRLETDTTELHDVMIKMIELSIQSTNVQTRQAARSTVISYVKNYNLKKKLQKVLDIFCAQLGYEHEFGRLSASDGLKGLIGVIGTDKMDGQASFLFISLAPHIVNDDSSACRKAVASTLSSLLKTVSPSVAEKLLASTMTWFKSPDNPGHVQLACHLLTLYVDTLATAPFLASKVDSILAGLPNCLSSNSDTEDHLTIQALTLLSRMFQHKLLEPGATREHVANVWACVHTCLLHSHSWARLLSAQLLGLHLSSVPPEKIVTQCQKNTKGSWIQNVGTVKSLVLDSIEQLSLVTDDDSELGTQIVKNLVALIKITLVSDWEALSEESEDRVVFSWIVRKVMRVANQELVSSPSTTTKRILVFNLIAAACLGAEQSRVESILRLVIPGLHRAVVGPVTELKTHCQEVLDLIKSRVEDEHFNEVYMEIQLSLSKQKGERAQSKKQNLIKNPEAAAKRKIRMNESKKRIKKAKFQK